MQVQRTRVCTPPLRLNVMYALSSIWQWSSCAVAAVSNRRTPTNIYSSDARESFLHLTDRSPLLRAYRTGSARNRLVSCDHVSRRCYTVNNARRLMRCVSWKLAAFSLTESVKMLLIKTVTRFRRRPLFFDENTHTLLLRLGDIFRWLWQ